MHRIHCRRAPAGFAGRSRNTLARPETSLEAVARKGDNAPVVVPPSARAIRPFRIINSTIMQARYYASCAARSLRTNGENAEPYYRVLVALDQQAILAYGKREPLRPGMRLDADILGERRRLYEWILEPIYSIRGQVAVNSDEQEPAGSAR